MASHEMPIVDRHLDWHRVYLCKLACKRKHPDPFALSKQSPCLSSLLILVPSLDRPWEQGLGGNNSYQSPIHTKIQTAFFTTKDRQRKQPRFRKALNKPRAFTQSVWCRSSATHCSEGDRVILSASWLARRIIRTLLLCPTEPMSFISSHLGSLLGSSLGARARW